MHAMLLPDLGSTTKQPPEGRPPAPWATSLAESLEQNQIKNLMHNCNDGGALTLGGDCTGANATFYAFSEFAKGLSSVHGENLSVKNAFGSEMPGSLGQPSVKFLKINKGRPEVLYADITERTETGGPVFWPTHSNSKIRNHMLKAKGPRAPKTRLYQAGTVCRDLSHANRMSPKALDAVLTTSSGESSKTLHGSIDYLMTERPPFGFLENTYQKAALKLICRIHDQTPHGFQAVGECPKPECKSRWVIGRSSNHRLRVF